MQFYGVALLRTHAREAVCDGEHREFRAAGHGGCRPYRPSSPAAAGQITLFPHSRSSAAPMLMLFGIDPAGRVEPTIGPNGLPSMYSITGASTFRPHEHCGQTPSRGRACSAPDLARRSATRRWPRPWPYSIGIGDCRSLSSDRPGKASSNKRSAPGFVPLCITAPGTIACDLDHNGLAISW
jgi:hypothetical protein